MFAGDRMDAKNIIQGWLDSGYFVLVDRFVYSNIAFQCAKISSRVEQEKLASWIMELEYRYNRLPVPDLNIFLDVPFHFTRQRLTENREGDDRAYLKGQKDIHEQDLGFQEKVSQIYHTICSVHGNLKIINCADEDGNMQAPASIFEHIKEVIDPQLK